MRSTAHNADGALRNLVEVPSPRSEPQRVFVQDWLNERTTRGWLNYIFRRYSVDWAHAQRETLVER
jgi:hypothetical protein